MTASASFRRQKWRIVLWILAGGMYLALLWLAWEAFAAKKGYPESYLFGPPWEHFNDFSDNLFGSTLANPYAEPFMNYPPAAYVFLRALSPFGSFGLIFISFVSLTALAYLLTVVLRPFAKSPWTRVSLAYLFLALSYPLLFCLERGNIEIVIFPLVAWAIFFFSRRRDVEATACLIPAICLKLYPALFLVVLLRRGKLGLLALAGIGTLGITAACFFFFKAAPTELWTGYRQNLDFYRDFYVLTHASLEGGASPWNAYLISVMGLESASVIPRINFDFNGSLVDASYDVYRVILALLALVSIAYAWLLESKLTRAMLLPLLFISIAAPSGADYRLAYATMALLIFILIPTRRRGDLTALILIALAVIPKKETLLPFAGTTETGTYDVSIQAFLNPILILVAMGVLLLESVRRIKWPGAPRHSDHAT